MVNIGERIRFSVLDLGGFNISELKIFNECCGMP